VESVNGRVSPNGEIDVLFVNTFEKIGGAARAAYRIFSEIRNRSIDAHYLMLIKGDPSPDISGRLHSPFGNFSRSFIGVLGRALVRALTRLDRIPFCFYPRIGTVDFSPDFWPNPLRIRLKRFRARLVHLHWVNAGLLGMEELGRLTCPIVWTLHDAWAFTGGCHYTRDCVGFKRYCGRCPQLGSQSENDYSQCLMRKKARVFNKLDITVVTPSRWLAEMAKQSSLFAGRRIEVIPNGLDTNVFKPVPRAAARERLGIPLDKPVVLFGAHSVTDVRKGWDLLRDALSRQKEPCTLLVFGDGEVVVEHAPHITVYQLGSVYDEARLALIYSAADVFVCPSREDNLPNTVAEALACGTPCAAFAVNGLPDMLEHQKTGWLAKPFDSAELAEGIGWLVEHPQPSELRQAAREKAVSDYSMRVMGDRYMALYEDVWKSARERNAMTGQFMNNFTMVDGNRVS
jgi:glycosyltransferase involved in cell wall biosynthesis